MKITFFKNGQEVLLAEGASAELEALKVIEQNEASKPFVRNSHVLAASHGLAGYLEQLSAETPLVAREAKGRNASPLIDAIYVSPFGKCMKTKEASAATTSYAAVGNAVYDKVTLTMEEGDCARTIKALAAIGYDPQYKTEHNTTVMSQAIFNGNLEAVQALTEIGVQPTREFLEKAVKYGEPDILEYLLAHTKHKDLSAITKSQHAFAKVAAQLVDSGLVHSPVLGDVERQERFVQEHFENAGPLYDAHMLRTAAHYEKRIDNITEALRTTKSLALDVKQELEKRRDTLGKQTNAIREACFTPKVSKAR